jgi:hypothetical protein
VAELKLKAEKLQTGGSNSGIFMSNISDGLIERNQCVIVIRSGRLHKIVWLMKNLSFFDLDCHSSPFRCLNIMSIFRNVTGGGSTNGSAEANGAASGRSSTKSSTTEPASRK